MTQSTCRVLHVSENPTDSQILQCQLDADILGASVERVESERHLAQLQGGAFDLVVVDLPLADVAFDLALARLQAAEPAMRVLFRWNVGGAWQYADGSEPLADIVRRTLQGAAPRPVDAAQRARTMDRIVRGQEVLLRLAQTDFWDFEPGLRTLTAAVARLMAVERVSVWEFDAGHRRLRCLDLYELSRDRHTQRMELSDFPHYLEALSASLMVAAHDAREDPRTREFLEGYLIPQGITSMLDAPIRSRGRVCGVVCLEHVGPARVWDVLEQCHAAAAANLMAHAIEVRDRRRVEHSLGNAERLSALGRTAARLAHDFNNRLAVIAMEAELALDRGDDPGGSWARVRGELAKASATARELMSLERPRVVPPEPVDLVAVLAGTRATLERLLGPGIELALELARGPLRVALRAEDFEQIVLNLVTNARDALRDGGRVALSLEPVPDGAPRARLVVEDDGVGMDESTRARLFEPFFTTKEGSQGSGLGLASSLASVDACGGGIRVESAPGEGTRVEVTLPLA